MLFFSNHKENNNHSLMKGSSTLKVLLKHNINKNVKNPLKKQRIEQNS